MAPSLSFDAKAPKSPKSPKRFFVFPMPGATSPDGEAVPPLPSLASFTNSRGRRGKHTPSSSISSFSSSSITALGGGGAAVSTSGGGGGGFSGATVVRTPQEALEGIRCLSPAPEPPSASTSFTMSGDHTPRSASNNPLPSPMRAFHAQRLPYPSHPSQSYKHNHFGEHGHTQSMSASFERPTFASTTSSPHSSSSHGHGHGRPGGVHRSNSAREELRDPMVGGTPLSPAPMRSAVVGLKGVLKSSSTSPLDAYGLGVGHSLGASAGAGMGIDDSWARELLSPSLVSELSLGAPLDSSFISTTSIAMSEENSTKEEDQKEPSTNIAMPHTTSRSGSIESRAQASWAPLSPVVREKTSFSSLIPPTPAPTSSTYTTQSQGSSRITSPNQATKRPSGTFSSHVRSPSTPSTPSPPTSYIPTHVRAPSSPGPSASTFVNTTFSKSAPVSKRTSPITPLSPPIPSKSARRPSLLSHTGTLRPPPASSSASSKGTTPFPVLSQARSVKPDPRDQNEAETAPFHATLLSQTSKPLPDGEEDTVLLRFEFAYSLDDPPNNEMLTLPLEVLRKGGQSRLLSWVEGHLTKEIDDIKSPVPSMSNPQKSDQTSKPAIEKGVTARTSVTVTLVDGRPESDLESAETEKKKSVATVPDMTDGESAEESDLESDNGLSALLRDEYLRSLVIAEPDSPTLRHAHDDDRHHSPAVENDETNNHLSVPDNDAAENTSISKESRWGKAETNPAQPDQQSSRKWTSGFGKRVPGRGKNQYIQLLSRFPLPSFPSSQSGKTAASETGSSGIQTTPAPPRTSSLGVNATQPANAASHSTPTSLPSPIPISKKRANRPSPRLELPAKPSFELLSPLQEVAEARLRELRIFLTREAGVWHRIAHRLISGSWGDERSSIPAPAYMVNRLLQEVKWAGMEELVAELGGAASYVESDHASSDPQLKGKSKSISPRCGPSPPITPGMWWAEVGPPPSPSNGRSDQQCPTRSRSKTLGSRYSGASGDGSGCGSGDSQSEGHGTITQSQRDMRKQKSMVLKGGKGYI
ncbi:hypothetical protein I317_03176 [Kwoniella heveanensis CBS 569]|nr:hypothetical protein I317_03176 [Kwoniella heveanensis CBS 569]